MRTTPFLVGLLTIGFICSSASAGIDVAKQAQLIDELLQEDWEKHQLSGNGPASDEAFVRRIYLDTIGRIPTLKEVRTFLESQEADKRAQLIDRLMNSDAHALHAFNYWADVLRLQNSNQGRVAGAAYSDYLLQSLRSNKRYDQMVRELVAAEGAAWDNGAIGYYVRDRGMPLDNLANTARIFLGTRIECAQCHNHPFDKWTQMDFYKMAAFTYGAGSEYGGQASGEVQDRLREREQEAKQLRKSADPDEAKRGEELASQVRSDQQKLRLVSGELRKQLQYTQIAFVDRPLLLPQDYEYDDAKPRSVVEPGVMMGIPVESVEGESKLQTYARWMASPENPRFTTVIVNRLWKRAFGLALIEPLDELTDSTVAVNPPLQTHLEKLMIDLDYDMKSFQRVIFNTKAYQSAVTQKEVERGEIYHFTGPLLRRMTAEQMWDSFVTLINSQPDAPNRERREAIQDLILGAKKIHDAIESVEPEQLFAGMMEAAKFYEQRREEQLRLQKEMNLARADDDKTKAREIGQQLSRLQADSRRFLNEKVIGPAILNLAAKKGVTPVVVETKEGKEREKGSKKVSKKESKKTDPSMMMMADGNPTGQIRLPGYDRMEPSSEEILVAEAELTTAWLEESEEFDLEEKERDLYLKDRASKSRNWARAAELDSPAPRGHLLREFGQSDRETIENANGDASVPQALAMMNGPIMSQMLGRYSPLMMGIRKANYPDDQVETVYLAILSRKPTQKEKDIWHAAVERNEDLGIEDLVFALLNTQQFLFIQ